MPFFLAGDIMKKSVFQVPAKTLLPGLEDVSFLFFSGGTPYDHFDESAHPKG